MDHPIKRPTFEEHIKQLFEPADVVCMRSQGIDLESHQGLMRDASRISEWIGSGRMPPPTTGRQWSEEKLQTFRNWGSNSGYFERKMVRLPQPDTPRIRKNLHALDEDELTLLKQAFVGIMERDTDPDDESSFFNLAGIHWLPGPSTNTFCRHHDDAYNPWHRAYLIAFENALRSVEGCESVTLPYWDILGDELPDWVYQPPFYKYALPYRLTSISGTDIYDIGYETERHDATTIASDIISRRTSIRDSIEQAMGSKTWRGFNGWSDWPNAHEGIIRAHDNGHAVCGQTIGLQDVAAFDPLFWFFHCNWDRLWWAWQSQENRKTLEQFKDVVTGDKHWLEEAPDTLLPPFDVNSSEMIDNTYWRVDYETVVHQIPVNDPIVIASGGNVTASSSFRLASAEKVSIRVKNINRLDIPGSFDVVLYADEDALDRTRVFQPSAPRACDNCTKQGSFSVDFLLDRAAIIDKDIRVAIEVNTTTGAMETVSMQNVGEPTINIRLLLHEQTDG